MRHQCLILIYFWLVQNFVQFVINLFKQRSYEFFMSWASWNVLVSYVSQIIIVDVEKFHRIMALLKFIVGIYTKYKTL